MKAFVALINGLLVSGGRAPSVHVVRNGIYLVFLSCAQLFIIVVQYGDDIRTYIHREIT